MKLARAGTGTPSPIVLNLMFMNGLYEVSPTLKFKLIPCLGKGFVLIVLMVIWTEGLYDLAEAWWTMAGSIVVAQLPTVIFRSMIGWSFLPAKPMQRMLYDSVVELELALT